jgi:HSP20 family protein
MRVVRYNAALNDFLPTSFSNLVDSFFNDSVSRSGGSAWSFVPKVDIIESENAFEIQIAVAGLNKEDIKIDLKDRVLTVSGERKLDKEHNENNFRSIETQYGTFGRSFSLPEHVNADKINAKYNNGILQLVVPKDVNKPVKTTIPVA